MPLQHSFSHNDSETCAWFLRRACLDACRSSGWGSSADCWMMFKCFYIVYAVEGKRGIADGKGSQGIGVSATRVHGCVPGGSPGGIVSVEAVDFR